MSLRFSSLESGLGELQQQLALLHEHASLHARRAIERIEQDLLAAKFHVQRARHAGDTPIMLVVLGGTGTGKSTLVNRLLDDQLSATSFRRTFTAGAVAVARAINVVPQNWLNLQANPIAREQLPARGTPDSLAIVCSDHPLTARATIVDTPDLDGDNPAHHGQADRAFRWSETVLFLVTPEKYQMTELLPYYKLAQRYAIAAMYVMNKAEEQAVVDDYARQLEARGVSGARVFAIARDDAGFVPREDIEGLRSAIAEIRRLDPQALETGISNRVGDLLDRLRDQVIAPIREDRKEAERLIGQLRALETPPPGLDVNPLTRQLQRRLQQRSVLYLMGPGRVLDRVRQVPGLLARLPRTAWDLLRGGEVRLNLNDPSLPKDWERGVPDFKMALVDQFTIVQSRIDDLLRSNAASARWITEDQTSYAASKISPDHAGAIAESELAELKNWLEKRWNATPRDTAMLKKLLKLIPGGEKLTAWSEAAPYLLAIVVAAHHAFFGHVDLMILGGYGLATWLTERLSNEVTSRARQTNARMAERFARMAHEQIERTSAWLATQAPAAKMLDQMQKRADELQESLRG
jgi:hypothetical protein